MRIRDLRRRQGDMPQQSWRRGFVWGRRWLCFVALAALPPGALGNCSIADLPGFPYSEPKLGLVPASVPNGFLITYSCKLGFVWIPGMKRSTMCHDEIWSPIEESCSVAKCNDPIVKHGRILSGFKPSYTNGDNVTFECEIGYFMVGSYFIHCQTHTWYPAVPSCKTMSKCKDPIVEHGTKLSGFKQSYTGGDNVTFECNIGYFMIGSYFIQCENHTWYPTVPSCNKIVKDLCGAPILPYGMVEPLRLQYRIGSIIAVYCKPNYSFPDETIEMSLTCGGFNLWEPTVQPCFLRTSPDTSTFFIHNGKIVSGKKKIYEPGDKITVECHPGYALNGPHEIRYVGGGKWLPVHPRCYLNAFFTLLITVLVFIALLLILEMLYRKWKSEY